MLTLATQLPYWEETQATQRCHVEMTWPVAEVPATFKWTQDLISYGKTCRHKNESYRKRFLYSQIPTHGRHDMPHRTTWEAPGPVRRQRDGGEHVDKSLYGSFHGKEQERRAKQV